MQDKPMIPPFVWGYGILIVTLVIATILYLVFQWLLLVGYTLLAMGVVTGCVCLSVYYHRSYHMHRKMIVDRQTSEYKRVLAEQKAKKALLENTILAQLPILIKYGIDQGMNVKYQMLEMTDWRSNVHTLAGATNVSQIETPKKPLNRLSLVDCVNATSYNSLAVCVGSVRDSEEKALISFKKTHLKIIGASQKGKSSLVGSLLTVISQTHSADLVQFAILDMEDMTGNLFVGLPHVRMHARNKEDVADKLVECVDLMEWRYKKFKEDPTVFNQMPYFLIYVEEFLDLKNQLKAYDPARYKTVIASINTLALRGLKARCQLILCAQADYRDSGGELAGAMSSIPNGMSVCLLPSAARSAGFTNTELLNRNYQDNLVGVYVLKHPSLQNIIVAPDFNLEEKLEALEYVPPLTLPTFELPPVESDSDKARRIRDDLISRGEAHGYRPIAKIMGCDKDKVAKLLRDE